MKVPFFIARLLVVSLFLYSAYGKITWFDAQVELTASKWVPFANIAIILAIIFEVIGWVLLLIGKRGAWFGALLLLIFTLIVTPIFFDIWNDPTKQTINNFMKNVSLIWWLWFIVLYYKQDFAFLKHFFIKSKS